MNDKIVFSKILGIQSPWFISRVNIDETAQRVDIYVTQEKGILACCPECEEFYSVYDHSPERVYRHLNVCQMAAYIHVRLPRVNCPTHGVKQIVSDFGEKGYDMTYEYEEFILTQEYRL